MTERRAALSRAENDQIDPSLDRACPSGRFRAAGRPVRGCAVEQR
jgi:hypothetical protein